MPKPFDLEQAKAGKPVVTRGGKPVRIISFDGHPLRPVVGLIGSASTPGTRLINGRLDGGQTSIHDYMMADPTPVKVKMWVNIRYDGKSWIHRTEKEAENAAALASNGVKTYYRAVAIPTEVEYLPED